MAKVKIEYWPIERVLPYAQNAREHPPEQVTQLAASLRQFGFVNPALVDASGQLIAGHGRVMAAKSIGMETIPVVQLKHLDDAQVKALRIFDNSAQLTSTWNPELLQAELDMLEEMNFDLGPLGLDTIEFDSDLPPVETPPARSRKKTTIFLSVDNEKAALARDVVVKALNKAKIEHNL